MKSKKLLLALPALALMLGVLTTPTFAATQEGTTPVIFENTQDITDPDNPDGSTWAVRIPRQLTLTRGATTSANIQLIVGDNAPAGSSLTSLLGTKKVPVGVKSVNGYLVQNSTSSADYSLSYGNVGQTLAGTAEQEIAQLSAAAPEKIGTAFIVGTPTAVGTHTDTLTYVVYSAIV